MSNFLDIIEYNKIPSRLDIEYEKATSPLGRVINQIMNCDYQYHRDKDNAEVDIIKVYKWNYQGVDIYIKWLYQKDSICKTFELRSTTIDNIEAPTPFSETGYRSLNILYDQDTTNIKTELLEIAENMIKDLSDKTVLKKFEKQCKERHRINKEDFKYKAPNIYYPYSNKRDYLEYYLFEKYEDSFYEAKTEWFKNYWLKYIKSKKLYYPGIELDCVDTNNAIPRFYEFDRLDAGMHGHKRKYFIDVIKNDPKRICQLELKEEKDFFDTHREELNIKSEFYELSPKYFDLALKIDESGCRSTSILEAIYHKAIEDKITIDQAYFDIKHEFMKQSQKRELASKKLQIHTEIKEVAQQDLFI